jgi:HTH-type transcriptional regulator/antitoxin MqsA
MNDKTLCPICGDGHVTDHVNQMETEYKGQKGLVASHYQLCDVCGSDFAGAAEMRANKRTIQAFRKQVDSLLSGAEILALRKHYGLTQPQAARLFGGGPVAFSKYENDDVAHSEAMDKLLRLVLRSETAFWDLVEQEGMTAELRPAKSQKVPAFSFSNVIKVDFARDGFKPAPVADMHPYEPGEKTWK